VPVHAHRWLSFSSKVGSIAFSADRNVLLCILAYRYGVPPGEMQVPAGLNEWNERETATEQRLAAKLGRQLVSAAAAAIDALQPDVTAAPVGEFTPSPSAPAEGAWTLHVAIAERAHGLAGTLRFRFDEQWIARLMRRLAPKRERRQGVHRPHAQPLPARLQLALNARLIEKQIDLGTLLDLRVGDIIPVTVASADVLIGDSHLFTASIAEFKGKLCLTRFDDVE
jgi:flagellar motor switch protein FliM